MTEKDNTINYSEHFYYDDTSPTGLRWNRDVLVGIRSSVLRKTKGAVAGYRAFYKNGIPRSCFISLEGKGIATHRVIWELFYGPIPDGYVIDHLDGNPFNNNIGNLSCKTQRHNIQNSSKSRNNTSGITGVSKRQFNGNPIWYWQARVRIGGKVVAKSFSTAKHGEDGARKLATEWRELQLKILNENGESYTERHGK